MWCARVCVSVLLVCVVADDIDKKAEIAPAPFILGSRYGRSSLPVALRVMAPRNDRFFMGSRYGKRSPASVEPPLVCSYTGIAPLYRCVPRVPAHLAHLAHPGSQHTTAHLPHTTLYATSRKSDEEPFLGDLEED